MPSLSPGTPGAKEAYDISIIAADLSFAIPLKAMERYDLFNQAGVYLITGRKDEPSFGLIQMEKGIRSVFNKYVKELKEIGKVLWFNKKAYGLAALNNNRVSFTPEMLESFYLKKGDELLSLKSTTTTLSFTRLDVWKEIFLKQGFTEAVHNVKYLEVLS
jgi:hypothetical protein